MSSNIIEISKIEEITAIEKADKIVLARIKGFNSIISKDMYKVGDLVVFIPPDSVMPNNLIEKYKLEFLKKDGRVKTVKLRGVISEGLILDIPEGCKAKEGLNVASLMGITHWEPPEPKQFSHKKETLSDIVLEVIHRKISIRRFIFKTLGLIRDNFKPKKKTNPYFDKYTEIENIKHFPNIFEEYEQIIILEKIHGANFRVGYLPKKSTNIIDKIINKFTQDYQFCYGSHNIQKSFNNLHNGYYKEDIWGKVVKNYNLENRLPKDYIFYGEIFGGKCQDLTYGLKDIELRIFDIKNVKTNKYLDWNDTLSLCNQYNLPIVPILYTGEYGKDLEKRFTIGNSLLCPSQIREGCVIKPIIERYDHKLGRVILKSINEEYLLRKNGTEFK